jgi:hypothetical protein
VGANPNHRSSEIAVQTDQSRHLQTLLNLYLGLPETSSQASLSNARLAYTFADYLACAMGFL